MLLKDVKQFTPMYPPETLDEMYRRILREEDYEIQRAEEREDVKWLLRSRC